MDEFCELQLARVAGSLTGDGETVHLHGTDREVEWLLTLDPGGLVTRRAHEDADVVVRGSAARLMLLLWNRIPVDASDLDVVGDRRLLDRILRGVAL